MWSYQAVSGLSSTHTTPPVLAITMFEMLRAMHALAAAKGHGRLRENDGGEMETGVARGEEPRHQVHGACVGGSAGAAKTPGAAPGLRGHDLGGARGAAVHGVPDEQLPGGHPQLPLVRKRHALLGRIYVSMLHQLLGHHLGSCPQYMSSPRNKVSAHTSSMQ